MRDRKLAAASLESLPEEWKAIDVLVNNAGLVIGVDKEFEGSLDEWGYHDRYEYKGDCWL